MTRRGDRGGADREIQGVRPRRDQLQLLAAHPRQRRGGALGREGGELGQALRHRPAQAGDGRRRRWATSSRRSAGSRTSACSTSSASPTWRSASTAEACARYGINVADVEAVVQVAIGGKAFSQMVEGEKLYDIVLRLPEGLRDDPAGHPPDRRGRPGQGRQDRGTHPALQPGRDPRPPAGRLVHLPREQPPLHPDQVQRRGPRPELGDQGGAEEGRRPPTSCPAATTSSGRASSSRWRRPTPA